MEPINDREHPDEQLWEGIVTHDATASAIVRVYALTREEAVERMTDSDLVWSQPFELTDNYVYEYYVDEDGVEPVTEEDS